MRWHNKIAEATENQPMSIPLNERKAGVYKRINQIMASLHWLPIKVRDRRGLRAEHYRRYMRKLIDRPRPRQS
jgi:hypothetical protein